MLKKPLNIQHCQVCHITIDASLQIYTFNSSVILCQSCRKIHYKLWREILEKTFPDMYKVRDNLHQVCQVLFKFLNSETLTKYCCNKYLFKHCDFTDDRLAGLFCVKEF